ncbi:MAG TPA: sensor histidine kinase, partial [Bryobacterales bacterium]|nr:sensor histidine kinase [Bryobacterales bacterium]
MLRFDASGQICWMNSAAREAVGGVTGVMSLLTSRRGQARFACLPLGRGWLWLGGAAANPLEEKLHLIQRRLAETYFHCGAHHLQLLRFQGLFLECAEHRLFRRSVADVYAALETERRRIARDLHDSASQSLTGIRLNLELVERNLDSANAEALDRLSRCKDLVAVALDEIRQVSHGLRPPDWGERDFSEAVELLVETMALRGKLQVEIGPIDTPKNLSSRTKTAFYRILQGGLANVVKHSGASRVRIEAPVVSGYAYLIIQDNGRGFDPHATPPGGGIGLKNMREHIEAVG